MKKVTLVYQGKEIIDVLKLSLHGIHKFHLGLKFKLKKIVSSMNNNQMEKMYHKAKSLFFYFIQLSNLGVFFRCVNALSLVNPANTIREP